MSKANALHTGPSVSHTQLPYSLLSGTPSKWAQTALFVSLLLLVWAYDFDQNIKNIEISFVRITQYDGPRDSLQKSQETINILSYLVYLGFLFIAATFLGVFSRIEAIVAFVAISVISTIVEATAKSNAAFLTATVLNNIYYPAIQLSILVLISDSTSLRNRVLFNMLPYIPYFVNSWYYTWIYAAVVDGKMSWRWGVGIFGFIDPISTIPLVFVLFRLSRNSRTTNVEEGSEHADTRPRALGKRIVGIDIIGLFLAVAAVVMIATPMTLKSNYASVYRSSEEPYPWSASYMIALLVVGVLCIPVFVTWEAFKGKTAMLPTSDLRNRGVWAALGVVFMANLTLGISRFDEFTVFRLAFPDIDLNSNETGYKIIATSSISVIMGVVAGVLARYMRQIKYIIVAGVLINIIGFGILLRFHGGYNAWDGFIAGKFMIGIGTGLVTYPALASLQTHVSHRNIASFTALYMILETLSYKISYSVGNAIADHSNDDGSIGIYGSDVLNHAQKTLYTVGICLTVLLLGFALLLKNPRLPDTQILLTNEVSDMNQDDEHPLQKTASKV